MSIADDILGKAILPTALSSAEIREQISAQIRRRSIFSAKMECARHLERMRRVLAGYAEGIIGQARARELLLASLSDVGFLPGQSEKGGIQDPAGRKRLELILRTNKQMAASVRDIRSQTADTLAQFPAWELLRFGSRRAPREDWPARWQAAGDAVAWAGARRSGADTRMIATKASPIWRALGEGAGGFSDTLGNPYPPFAFSSGLSWRDVSADECKALGLTVEDGQKIAAPSLDPTDEDIKQAAAKFGYTAQDFE